MSALLIFLVIVLYTLQSFFCRIYTDKYPCNKELAAPVFAVVCGVTVVIVSFICSGFVFECKPLTVLFGAINALILYAYDYFIIKASEGGPYSVLTTFNVSGGIVIPAIFATLVFGDEMGWVRIGAMCIIFAAVYMISRKPSGDGDKRNKTTTKFIIICSLLALSNGLYGTLLDAQSRITGAAEKEEMVAVTFLGAAVISLVRLAVTEKSKTLAAFRQTRESLIFLLLCALVSALAINALVFIIPMVNVAVLYSFDNGGVLLLSALLSHIFFKERLTKLNIAGCIIMSAGLALMSLAGFIF